jgi:hypothetical protein
MGFDDISDRDLIPGLYTLFFNEQKLKICEKAACTGYDPQRDQPASVIHRRSDDKSKHIKIKNLPANPMPDVEITSFADSKSRWLVICGPKSISFMTLDDKT